MVEATARLPPSDNNIAENLLLMGARKEVKIRRDALYSVVAVHAHGEISHARVAALCHRATFGAHDGGRAQSA